MKKGIILCLSAIAVAAVAAFAVITIYDAGLFSGSNKGKIEARTALNELVVGYINIDQLVTKGAFDDYFNESNRKMAATAITSEIEDKAIADHITAIFKDPNASGINFKKPVYFYVEETGNVIFVLEVKDVAKVDKTFELLSQLAEEQGGESLDIERDGNNRIIDTDEEAIIGYNKSRFIVVVSEDEYMVEDALYNALKKPLADLSIFGKSDIAGYVNYEKMMALVRPMIEEERDQYLEYIEEEPYYADYYQDELDQMNYILAQFDETKKYMSKNANAVVSLTFDPGRATFKTEVNGIDASLYGDLIKRPNNAHLKYISADAPFVMNAALNGKKLVEVLDTVLESDIFANSELNTNEFNMVMAIARDALKSIDGDITIAVEDLEGRYDSYYDDWYEEWRGEPVFDSASAAIMIDVNDDYIISNLGQYAGAILSRKDSTHFSGNLEGFDVTLGQDDGVLHAGITAPYTTKAKSATDTDWFKDVKDAMSFIVLDIEKFLECSLIDAGYQDIINNMDSQEIGLFNTCIKACDYAYISAKDMTTSEIVLVLDDKKTNSLKQVTDLFMPMLMQEVMLNM